MEASTTIFFWCLCNRCLTSSAVITLAKGGGQLALEDASSDGIIYLGGGVEAVKKVLVLRQKVQHSMELSMRMLRVHRRAEPSILV